MKKLIILFCIFALAIFLRTYKITQVPPALNWDEVSIGYNAYSILKTGYDEWGEFLPLHFKSYGEYKLPGQIYASIPAIFVFGLTPFAIRITPVLYGVITVFLMYLLTKELFRKESIALWSSFFLASSPWHIQLTRASFESSFALMWVVLGMWLFVKGFANAKYWVASVIPFVFAIYTYNSARAFLPIFIIVVFVVYAKKILKYKKEFLFAGIIFAILVMPIGLFVLKGEGSARYKLVSVTDEAGLVPRIEEQRNISKLPAPLTTLIHNRYTYIASTVIKNYLAHFSVNFLFINGAGHRQHHVQGIGELFAIQAPFLLLGLYLLTKNKYKFLPLIIVWNLTAQIPVAFTLDSIPHALRTLNALPTYQIVSAYGLVEFFKYVKNTNKLIKYHTVIWVIVVLLFILQFKGYVNNLFNIYPVKYSKDWQYGNKEVVDYIKAHYNDYDLIVFTRHYGEPHMFTLFYLQYDPRKFTTDPGLVRFETNDWVRVQKFDKFYFPDLGDTGTKYADIVAANSDSKILFIGKGGDFENKKSLLNVNFLDGSDAFELVAYNPNEN